MKLIGILSVFNYTIASLVLRALCRADRVSFRVVPGGMNCAESVFFFFFFLGNNGMKTRESSSWNEQG